MKKELKKKIVLISIVIIILAVIFFPNKTSVEEKTAKCIGEKAILYVQLGCSHCRTQENLFGENLEYLTIIDCYETPEKCPEITATPSWKIGEGIVIGIKSIDELKGLTGCE